MPKVTFTNVNKTIETTSDKSILECALENNVDLEHSCGGNCACTTCEITVESGIENLSPMTEDERIMLDATEKLEANKRLACQSRILSGDVKVRIP